MSGVIINVNIYILMPGPVETRLPPVTQRSGSLYLTVMPSTAQLLPLGPQAAPLLRVLRDQRGRLLQRLADLQPHQVKMMHVVIK